jgi:hypothetical protein
MAVAGHPPHPCAFGDRGHRRLRAPDLVRTAADLDAGTAIIVLPALVLFPLGYILLGVLHAYYGARWIGFLIGARAVSYTTGGLAIFGLGLASPVIEILELGGAVPYTLGLILMARPPARTQRRPRSYGAITVP